MLGIEPDNPDPELGYIVPGDCNRHGTFNVTRFVEKPSATHALELIGDGGLWNAFIIAAHAQALLQLFERRCPEIVMEMRGIVQRSLNTQHDTTAAMDLYDRLPMLDFSRHILHGQEMHLRALPVPYCGWSDLGTPKRVADALRRVARDDHAINIAMNATTHLNLAAQHDRLQLVG